MKKLIYFITLSLSFKAISAGPACMGIFAPKGLSPLIAIISGTNRAGAESMQVALKTKAIFEAKGARVQIIDLAKVPVEVYSSENYFNTPSEFQKNFDAPIAKADALVIIIPEYHGSFPGILKTFFDYVQAPLAGKPVSLIGISAGMWGARSPLSQFSETLIHRKANILSDAKVNIQNVSENKNTSEILDRLSQLVSTTIKSANSVNEKVVLLAKVKSDAQLDFDSSISVNGKLTEAVMSKGQIAYLRFEGPTEIVDKSGKVIAGQGSERHNFGFGMPLGKMKAVKDPMSGVYDIQFESGVRVVGVLKNEIKDESGKRIGDTFTHCTVSLGHRILFDPTWGEYDLVFAEAIKTVSY
jgi:chromate reductase